MSAVNVLVQKDAVYLLTDGATYDDQAIFQFAAPKAYALPHINTAIACRGAAVSVPLLACVLAAASSFADLKARIPELLTDALSLVRHVATSALGTDFQLFVAGWTEGQPDAFTVLTKADSGLPSMTPIPIPEHAFTPFEVDGPIHSDIWDIFGGRSVKDLDPRTDGLHIMESQRRHKVAMRNGRAAHIVGGFCQLTSVGASGVIATEVLKYWPDVPGKKINPETRAAVISMGQTAFSADFA